ncbi:DUF1553 domain-containing protein [Bremerella sp. JC817]|uniref:DUF1553 domain-containing protein n=1 Tax=Bremerella sp. JC817 TaxID=3231756 RepID=UPI0034587E3B
MSISSPRWLSAVCWLACALVGSIASAEPLPAETFENSVGAILSNHCVRCHNPKKQEGGLSLASAQAAFAGGESGEAIVPRQPDASVLLDYISGDEPEMPKGGTPLSKEEVETIRRWIATGADWPDGVALKANDTWWSRQPLKRPEVPAIPGELAAKVRTPIDAFIIAKQQEHGLQLSAEADARTLVRRLYFDLIGLPPTPDEMRHWTTKLESDDEAYAELVEYLLESPHYGERWARHWLDVVKYADTCGYDKDKLRRNAWPYRDYVIRSFNEDKPYTRFVQEQIAGDTLYPGEADGILGLGFIAAGPWDFIGHVEVPATKIDGKMARNLDRDEMVSNTMNTFCSVTIQCARCHDHKFDPYTQQHYYGLQAVFAAVDRAERAYDLDPAIEQQRLELAEHKQHALQQLASLDREMETAGGLRLRELQAELKSLQAQHRPKRPVAEHGYHSRIEANADQAKWVQIDLGAPVELARVVLHPCYDDYAGIGPGFGFPVRFKVEASSDPAMTNATTLADETSRDYPNPLLATYEVNTEVTARFIRITATKLAPRQNDFIFALSEVELLDANGGNLAAGAEVTALDSIEAPIRWGRANLTDGRWPQPFETSPARAIGEVQQELARIESQINTPERTTRRQTLQQQLQQTEAKLKSLPTGKMVYAAATHFKPQGSFQPTEGTPRTVHVLHRGNVTYPREEAIPGALPLAGDDTAPFDLADGHPEAARRAQLARWITNPEHPLTWRSIVNRIWQHHFDQPIVGSPNDFGRMGQLPTHPELLDWLAIEFRDNGESMKHLHRLIVNSSVYRQRSDHQQEFAAIDGGNQFYWRMNRRRLEAEEIRDAILAVSGRLNLQMGGPGYFLFELEKEAHSPHYEYHKFDPRDPASHRRSIYRFVVRSQPDPYMTTLDCADSSQSTPKRSETLTALQALSMLNNPFQLAMSEAFAARLQQEADTLPRQIERGIQLTLGRSATPHEVELFTGFAEQHGLVNLCRVWFNQSEFVYLD